MKSQTGVYATYLGFWENVTNTWNILVPPISSPIPGVDSIFQSFRVDPDAADVADDASIGDFGARWNPAVLVSGYAKSRA